MQKWKHETLHESRAQSNMSHNRHKDFMKTLFKLYMYT